MSGLNWMIQTRQMADFAREPSDSQIDGGCGLAAKGRQLERAGGRCTGMST
jgi:hypothetical protein